MGLFDNFTPEARFMMGAGIMGGQNIGQGVMQGAQLAMPIMAANKEQAATKLVENKTREWLKSQYPGEDFDTMTPDMMKLYAQEAMKKRFATPDIPALAQEYNFAKQNGFQGSFMDYQKSKANLDGSPQTKLGLNPQYGVDDQGNPVLLQLSPDGKTVRSQLPEGVKLSKEPIKLDAGTHYILMDPITRQNIGVVPKDIAGVEKEKAAGKIQGDSLGSLAAVKSTAQTIKDMIASVKNDPYRERGTGLSSVFSAIPATGGYDFQRKVDQLKGQSFLQAIQQMQGFGALSNQEGATATAAISRLDTAQSEEAFNKALDDLEQIIDRGVKRVEAMSQGRTEIDQSQQPANANVESLVEKYRTK